MQFSLSLLSLIWFCCLFNGCGRSQSEIAIPTLIDRSSLLTTSELPKSVGDSVESVFGHVLALDSGRQWINLEGELKYSTFIDKTDCRELHTLSRKEKTAENLLILPFCSSSALINWIESPTHPQLIVWEKIELLIADPVKNTTKTMKAGSFDPKKNRWNDERIFTTINHDDFQAVVVSFPDSDIEGPVRNDEIFTRILVIDANLGSIVTDIKIPERIEKMSVPFKLITLDKELFGVFGVREKGLFEKTILYSMNLKTGAFVTKHLQGNCPFKFAGGSYRDQESVKIIAPPEASCLIEDFANSKTAPALFVVDPKTLAVEEKLLLKELHLDKKIDQSKLEVIESENNIFLLAPSTSLNELTSLIDLNSKEVIRSFDMNVRKIFKTNNTYVFISTEQKIKNPSMVSTQNQVVDVLTGNAVTFPSYYREENSNYLEWEGQLFIYGNALDPMTGKPANSLCANCVHTNRIW
jgi:hypothetical protein